jgi:hypothetical protein
MVEFNLTTIIFPYRRDPIRYVEIQAWALDHCLSFIDCNLISDDSDHINWYYQFEFRDQGEAAWFKLKWMV